MLIAQIKKCRWQDICNQDRLKRLKLLYCMPGNKLSIHSLNKVEHPDKDADGDTVEIIDRIFCGQFWIIDCSHF